MNRQDLYKNLIKLAPFEDVTDDYRESLSKALRQVEILALALDVGERPKDWDSVILQVDKVAGKLKNIALNSYKGHPSTAYTKLSNLLSKQIQDKLFWKTIPEDSDFFRMRTFIDRRNGIGYKEMFHIPIKKRRQVGTERYSVSGYPCLYLGNSSYVCWEEMGRPQMSICWCSRLTNVKPLEILDLHVPSENEFCGNIPKYIVLMPLIIACMLPMMGKGTDVFKPEYLIPQLIMEWIVKNKKIGVYYTTSHLTTQTRKDFNYPDDKYNNIAIPIKNPLMDGAMNCPTLAQMFKITNPANYEIETLKYGEGLK